MAGSLPKALAALGHDVRVVLPYYRTVKQGGFGKAVFATGVKLSNVAPDTGLERNFDLRKDLLPGSSIPVYFIDQEKYFDREKLYGDESGDFPDNLERFAFFAHSVFSAAIESGFVPDIIHCHDWHTGMIPIFLRIHYKEVEAFKKAGTLFTVHNLAYQGLFPDHQYGKLGLPTELFQAEGLEFYGQVNFMKTALRFADRINTVSPRYADEIQGMEFGCGLEGVLHARRQDLSGIINGLDYTAWSPEIDPYLNIKYSKDSLDLKTKFKCEFVKSLGLDWDCDAPLLGVVSRLESMKGLDLLEEIMDYLMHMDMNFILLGTGEPRFMESFKHIGETYPDKASVHLTFNEAMAHRIEAASDFFVMPSRFEPCGLNQLISLRYGTVPVVRQTGGLANTVSEFDSKTLKGNGFTFHEFSSMGLFNAIKRALELYKNKDLWRTLQKNGMSADYSWGASARQYVDLYNTILEHKQAI